MGDKRCRSRCRRWKCEAIAPANKALDWLKGGREERNLHPGRHLDSHGRKCGKEARRVIVVSLFVEVAGPMGLVTAASDLSGSERFPNIRSVSSPPSAPPDA